MKKKHLEMLLERLEGHPRPAPEREQYDTPASVAADMLFLAYLRGDLGVVCDLGCGAGILSVGAAMLGARAVGVEIDTEALAAARRNAERLGACVDFIRADVNFLSLKGIDTVIMNPPFGAQKASPGDRAFLKKATQMARTVYTLHNAGSEAFIRRFIEPCHVQEIYRIPFPLKRSFKFHREDMRIIEVELYRITCL